MNESLVGLCVIIFMTNYPRARYVGNECTLGSSLYVSQGTKILMAVLIKVTRFT